MQIVPSALCREALSVHFLLCESQTNFSSIQNLKLSFLPWLVLSHKPVFPKLKGFIRRSKYSVIRGNEVTARGKYSSYGPLRIYQRIAMGQDTQDTCFSMHEYFCPAPKIGWNHPLQCPTDFNTIVLRMYITNHVYEIYLCTQKWYDKQCNMDIPKIKRGNLSC
jgi:hypothetical protein